MTVTIYQINLERDTDHMAFERWSYFQRKGYIQPPAELYDAVYTYQTELETPEGIYKRFNRNPPEDFTGRSLSVSDIVEFIWPNGACSHFFCDAIGFQPVAFEIV